MAGRKEQEVHDHDNPGGVPYNNGRFLRLCKSFLAEEGELDRYECDNGEPLEARAWQRIQATLCKLREQHQNAKYDPIFDQTEHLFHISDVAAPVMMITSSDRLALPLRRLLGELFHVALDARQRIALGMESAETFKGARPHIAHRVILDLAFQGLAAREASGKGTIYTFSVMREF